MGPKTSSGFYLSKTSAALLALLLAVLFLALIILAALYARTKAPDPEEVHSEIHSNSVSLPLTSTPSSSMTPTPDTTGRPGIWDNLRLPKNLVPLHYDLELWPRMLPDSDDNYLLLGQVNITIQCVEKTDIVLLHSYLLNISRAELKVQKKGEDMDLVVERDWGQDPLYKHILRTDDTLPSPVERIGIKDLWVSEVHQYLVLELEGPLVAGGLYTLELDYQGFLSNDLQGLFLTHYKDLGMDKVLIASEMEPTSARTVYPCFDEPAFKATFKTRMVHNSSYVALSNMPAIAVSKREDVDGYMWTVTTFNTTLKMSTYITAFVICDFDYVNTTERGHEIRIWARKEVVQNGYADFARSIVGPLLSFMEDLLNITYPLQKTDFVALPYFGVGAMENWGLITFHEPSLIYNPKHKFRNSKALVCLITAHEIGHQWFGNLVTMKWWNDIWLNEGFASYMELLGASSVDCKLKLNEMFVMHSLANLLRSDSKRQLRALSVKEDDIHKTDNIVTFFDIVSYNKGAAFVRMLSTFLTEKLFLKGIRSYLKTFSFSNADQDELWDHLQMIIDDQEEVQLPASLKQIMDSWTWHEGIPLLTLNTSTGNLIQEQLKTASSNNITSNNNNTWIIPVSWMKNGVEQSIIWLNNQSSIFPELKITSDDDWILININITGYYRINYDGKNWNNIAKQLQKSHKVLPVVNRVQLIDNAFTLAKSGYIEYDAALGLTKYLEKEDEIIVWDTVLSHIMPERNPHINYITFPLIKKYILQRINPIYQHYASLIRSNFDETADDYLIHTTINNIFKTACSLGLQDCLDLAREMYSVMMDNSTNEIPYSVQNSITCYAISVGNEREWEFAWNIFNKSISEDHYDFDNEYLSQSLCCTKEPWLLQRYLHNILEIGNVHVALDVFQAMIKQDLGKYIAWDFLKENFDRIKDLVEGKDYLFQLLLPEFGYKAISDLHYQEIQQLINRTVTDRDSTLERLESNRKSTLEWTSLWNTKIYNWLQKNTDDSDF
ncbi:aminopeptidase Q [Pelobates cultripes]|uniref:Aminopeptidase Q n=2 Tax=Pelobates cultripes TaxID=61616 RepID=A0AAD1SFE7_PELCU|nr:aminopeptidase Q [Pelobates cultripes]